MNKIKSLSSWIIANIFKNKASEISPAISTPIVQDHTIPSLIVLYPDKFIDEISFNDNKQKMLKIECESDFNWIEDQIKGYGFYNNLSTNIWTNQEVNNDKLILALIAYNCLPNKVLDIGCANGALVKALVDIGIDAYGIDISEIAIDQKLEGLYSRLSCCDIIDYDSNEKFDFIYVLDLLEHINPNKIDSYIQKIYNLLSDGGYCFLNIPVWGKDEVWGSAFPLAKNSFADAYPSWIKPYENDELFKTIPVDE